VQSFNNCIVSRLLSSGNNLNDFGATSRSFNTALPSRFCSASADRFNVEPFKSQQSVSHKEKKRKRWTNKKMPPPMTVLIGSYNPSDRKETHFPSKRTSLFDREFLWCENQGIELAAFQDDWERGNRRALKCDEIWMLRERQSSSKWIDNLFSKRRRRKRGRN
jgi:hypothetical protein